jgi:hypothetical protein
MFHDVQWKSRDGFFLHLRMYDYIIVDMRLSQNAPADGYLFDNEKGRTYTKPLSHKCLTKFAGVEALSEVWRNDHIVIYHNDAVRWPIPNELTPILQPF